MTRPQCCSSSGRTGTIAACLLIDGSNSLQNHLGEEMTTQLQKAKSFRKLHVPGEPLILFNIWDPGSAKAVGGAGAKALATSSWAVSEANGYTDGEHTPLAFVMENLRRIIEATDLPVTVDLESGYGDTP